MDITDHYAHQQGKFSDNDYVLLQRVWHLLDEYRDQVSLQIHHDGPSSPNERKEGKRLQIIETMDQLDDLLMAVWDFKHSRKVEKENE